MGSRAIRLRFRSKTRLAWHLLLTRLIKNIGGVIIKHRILTALIAVALIASFTAAFPVAAAGQTITVGPSATYKTIQSAVNAAVAGDTILVQTGTYNENVVVAKAVTIKAASGATPVVDAGSRGPAFRVKAAATIDGFTIRNSWQL